MGVLSGNRSLSGGHKKKKQGNLRQNILVICYVNLKLLVSLENLKNARRGDLILAKLKAASQ